ncbi:MAG: hypothetical protein ACT4PU_00230 [Planctomycetota bacterium]
MNPTRHFSRRILSVVALLAMAVPAAALMARLTVYFAATFNTSGSPGASGIPAEIGQFGQAQPVSEFVLVADPSGGSQLSVSDAGTSAEASMTAAFKKPFKGSYLENSFYFTALQSDTSFVVSALDDSDTGMIDLEFGDDGDVLIDGVSVAEYEAGVEYFVRLVLVNPFMGPSTWVLRLNWGVQESVMVSGPMQSSAWSTIGALKLVRPAGSTPGSFLIDDLRAVSQETTPVN